MLPPAQFEQFTEQQEIRLAVNKDAEAYLVAKQEEIRQKLTASQERIGKLEGSLILDEKGHLHLPPGEKAVSESEEVECLQMSFISNLAQVSHRTCHAARRV